jgi:eukaryotic-like serine/threonine-protein kinase
MVMSYASVDVAGRYRLEDRVASGGVGEVWRARDLVLGRPVAVKLLRAEYAEHPETLARFRAEAQHAASLSHPGIAHVYDYGDAAPPHSPYLVMELVNGPSLATVLAAGPLDATRAMDVIAQAAAGLAVAHAAGLVHRDIKPANLLLGPGDQVKITDFGIAYAAGSAPITRTGTLVGTPAYLSPERAAGEPAGPASDLYSLGVVGYECLVGRPPFSGTPLEVAGAHRYRPLPPLPPATPGAVAVLITELTAKDPAARPATAGEVAARAGRLRDALRGGAVLQPAAGTAAVASALAGEQRPALADRQPPALADRQPPTLADRQPPTVPAQRAPSGAGQQPPTLADASKATLTGMPALGEPSGNWRQGQDRPWRRRGIVLAAAAITVGLAGWLLAGLFTAAPSQQPPASPQATAASATSSARLVEVNGDALVGQQVSDVQEQLSELGLRPRVVWAHGGESDPGTVLSVQPTGQVPAGSVITVTAVQMHGHGNGHDNGKGGGD